MLKILILEDDPNLKDRIAFILESVPGVSIIQASDRNQAVQMVNDLKGKIDLLIVDYHAGPLTSLGELKKGVTHVDCIFCVQDKKTQPEIEGWKTVGIIDRSFIATALLITVEKWLGKQKKVDLNQIEAPKYCRIKTSLLVDVSPLHSDIYAKLSETKYVKLFQKSDVFDRDDLTKYAEQKKIEYMYLLTENCKEFVQKYIDHIEDLARQNRQVTVDEITFMHSSIQEQVQELTDKLGFTPEVQSLAKSQVQLTVKTLGKKPLLKQMIRRLEGQKGQYLSDHSFLTGFLACAVSADMEWGSETTFLKLTLAAFMHDIVITNHALGECETIEEARKLGVSEREFQAFQRHPYLVSEMIRQMSEIPPDVDTIVMQHHERPDGTGFPRELQSSYIAPLAAIFIVAHDLAKAILKEKERFDLAKYVDSSKNKYSNSQFKKILSVVAALEF